MCTFLINLLKKMIKNIVLDVGGVIFDDSKQNIQKLLNKNCDNIYNKRYKYIKCMFYYRFIFNISQKH